MPTSLLQLILFALAAQASLRGDLESSAHILDEYRSRSGGFEQVSFTNGNERHDFNSWVLDLRARDACAVRIRYYPSIPVASRNGYVLPRYHSDHRLGGRVDSLGRQIYTNANPAPWGIEVTYPHGIEYWSPEWRLIEPRPETGPVWSVTYAVADIVSRPAHVETADQAAKNLETSLRAISQFDLEHGRGHWSGIAFQPAIDLLNGSNPSAPPGTLPPDLGVSPDRASLLLASAAGWVFGGMGAWNDNGPPRPELSDEYEQITMSLYDAVSFGFVAGVNAGQPEICPTP
mgnify:CR=1 FL=1